LSDRQKECIEYVKKLEKISKAPKDEFDKIDQAVQDRDWVTFKNLCKNKYDFDDGHTDGNLDKLIKYLKRDKTKPPDACW